MTDGKGKKTSGRALRRRAEKKLAQGNGLPAVADEETHVLVHELQVHQIELKMQNEELRLTQLEAEEQRRRYQDLYDFAPVGYLTLDEAGIVREANFAAASLLGCERGRLVGAPLLIFLAPASRGDYVPFLRRLLDGASGARCEVRLGANAKRSGWLLLDGGTNLDDTTRQAGRVALVDITERRRFERKLRTLETKATHDSLTGLWNHGEIFAILEQELARAERDGECVGVIMADLDLFKEVNDTYGHMAGDAVLRLAAQRMLSLMRGYDFVGRYGGEEFLVIVPACCRECTVAFAERLRLCICGGGMETPEGIIPVTASFGVAANSKGERCEAATLVKAADAALYRAKQKGRNRVEVA